MIEKALKWFSRNLPREDKEKIFEAFKVAKFGMQHTFFRYKNKYYQYGRVDDEDDIGTSIGGYESAFFTDIVGQYILEKLLKKFSNTIYAKLYRNDGILVFRKLMSIVEIEDWLKQFQEEVNKLLNSDKLRFTMEL